MNTLVLALVLFSISIDPVSATPDHAAGSPSPAGRSVVFS
jgi:hypothetical protein